MGQALQKQANAGNSGLALSKPKDSFGSFSGQEGSGMNSLKDWTSGEGRLSQQGYALYFLAPGAAHGADEERA